MVQEIIAKKTSLLFGVSKNFDDFELKSGFEDIMPIRKVAKFRQMCTQMPKFVRQIFSKKKRFERSKVAICLTLIFFDKFNIFRPELGVAKSEI